MSTGGLTSLSSLQASLEKAGQQLPPVENWHPENCGEIDIKILADGRWIHEGSEIKRQALIRLFSRVLRLDDDGYYLVTPVEKAKITVEDAPFLAVGLSCLQEDGEQSLLFTTNMQDQVIVDKDHPIWVEQTGPAGSPRPYVMVRRNLKALITRSVYYELVNLGEVKDDELVVHSTGSQFPLGSLSESTKA